MKSLLPLVSILGLAATLSNPVYADDDEQRRFTATNPAWQTECSSCHVAYPPPLLPATSWQAVMDGLPDHFGVDASLDAETTQEITAFLRQHAGRERKQAPTAQPLLRITETRWFKNEHEEEVPASVWNKVKSPSDCAACHRGAADGDYSEDNIRLPR